MLLVGVCWEGLGDGGFGGEGTEAAVEEGHCGWYGCLI